MGPILLVTLRAIQGFAVGGEWEARRCFPLKVHRKIKKPFTVRCTSWLRCRFTAFNRTGFIDSMMTTDEQFLSWGWRIPFLLASYWYWEHCGCAMAWRSPRIWTTATLSSCREKTHPGYRRLLRHPGAFLKIIALRLCELRRCTSLLPLHLIIQPRIWGYARTFP